MDFSEENIRFSAQHSGLPKMVNNTLYGNEKEITNFLSFVISNINHQIIIVKENIDFINKSINEIMQVKIIGSNYKIQKSLFFDCYNTRVNNYCYFT